MYCDRCGTQMAGSQGSCPSCGKHFMPLMPAPHKLDGHIRLLGILWVAISALRLIPGFLLLIGFELLRQNTFDDLPTFVPMLAQGLIAMLWVNLIGGAVAGYGLLTHQSWARPATIVMAILNLWDLPFGAALGIYSLWALLPADHEAQFRRMTEQTTASA